MKPLRSCPRKTRGVPPLLLGLGFCSWAEMAYRERRCELDSGHKKVAPRHKARLPAVPRLLGEVGGRFGELEGVCWQVSEFLRFLRFFYFLRSGHVYA